MNLKRIIGAGCKYIFNRDYRFRIDACYGRYNHLPDDVFLRREYKAVMGHPLNLDNPVAFNEKLQWLKLYDRKPEYTMMADKYAVRDYVAKTIGEEYLIPLLGVWENPEDVPFEELPEQFVLKCNHNSGTGMYICKDKSKLDVNKVKEGLARGLQEDYYIKGREWPYKNISRKIIAEQYMQDASGNLDDYKFMCFDGEVKCSFVCSDRFTGKGLHVTFFDLDWNVMPFERSYPSQKEGLAKPSQYEKMLELAKVLSKDIPFVRVDFYEVDGRIYFGEMTFFPGSGLEAFQPTRWDEEMGSWLTLPEKTID